MNIPLLTVENLTVRYGSLTVADQVSFRLERGQWLMLTGPNGAGKSTIIQAISQGVPFTGRVSLAGKDLGAWKKTMLAQKMGVMDQSHAVNYAFRVEEVVRLGRYAYRKGLWGADAACEEAVGYALEMTGLTQLRQRPVLELSGGELQRVFLAQVFAQDPQILILDEPANHLDLIFQKQVFSLIRDWVGQKERAVLSVVHDLSLAKAFGSHALLLKKGRVIAYGEADRVLARDHLEEAYEMDVYDWMQFLLEQWR